MVVNAIPIALKKLLTQGRLTHEMAAPVGKMDRDAWQLLFEDMPIGALVAKSRFLN